MLWTGGPRTPARLCSRYVGSAGQEDAECCHRCAKPLHGTQPRHAIFSRTARTGVSPAVLAPLRASIHFRVLFTAQYHSAPRSYGAPLPSAAVQCSCGAYGSLLAPAMGSRASGSRSFHDGHDPPLHSQTEVRRVARGIGCDARLDIYAVGVDVGSSEPSANTCAQGAQGCSGDAHTKKHFFPLEKASTLRPNFNGGGIPDWCPRA